MSTDIPFIVDALQSSTTLEVQVLFLTLLFGMFQKMTHTHTTNVFCHFVVIVIG